MLEKIKAWFEKWKVYLAFAGAFLMWLIAYTLWSMYGRRSGSDAPAPPTLDVDAEIRAAQRDVATEQVRQQAERIARERKEAAARVVREEMDRRGKQIDETAKNGTDADLARELENELNRRP